MLCRPVGVATVYARIIIIATGAHSAITAMVDYCVLCYPYQEGIDVHAHTF